MEIILQIITGIVALLTALLDYTWRDKRKVEFKKNRKYLYIAIVTMLIVSIIVTIISNQEKDLKSKELSNQLTEVRDSLFSMQSTAKSMESKLSIIAEIAAERYPGLSDVEAIEKLEKDLEELEKSTSILRLKEEKRRVKENSLLKTKTTSPEFDLGININNDSLYLIVYLKNKIPFRFTYQFITDPNNFGNYMLWNEPLTIIPREGYSGTRYFIKKLSEIKDLDSDKWEKIAIEISYESFYYKDYPNDKAKGILKKDFQINIAEKKVK